MHSDDLMNLRVSEHEKTKEWFEFHADRNLPAFHQISTEDLPELDKLYRFINNDLTGYQEELKRYCSPFEGESDLMKMVPYNPIPNKLDVLKGDYLRRSVPFRVSLLTAEAIHRKDKEFADTIQKSVNDELQIAVAEQRGQFEQMGESERQQAIEQMRSSIPLNKLSKRSFRSQSEITYAKMLQYGIRSGDYRTKSLDSLVDTIVASQMYIWTGWRKGRPVYELLNNKYIGFHKDSNTLGVEKSDYWHYRQRTTIVNALDELVNTQSDEKLKQLIDYANSGNRISKDHITKPVFDHTRYYSLLARLGYGDGMLTGTSEGNRTSRINFQYELDHCYMEFKAYKRVIFLTHNNDYGQPITVQLNDVEGVIPDDLKPIEYTNRFHEESEYYQWVDITGQQFTAEVLWIPRRYEVERWGSDLYTNMREVPFQPEYDNPFLDFELSLKGGIYSNRNTKWISPMQRAIPYTFQYMSTRRVQDRELAKFIGAQTTIDVDQQPNELSIFNEEEGEDIMEVTETMAREGGLRFIAGAKTRNGMPIPSTRSQGVRHEIIDSSPLLGNLEQFCTQLDYRIGMRLGVSPAREGSIVNGNTATENQQQLVQSNISTMALMHWMDRVWSKVFNEHMINTKIWIRGHLEGDNTMSAFPLEVALPNGSKEYFEVTLEHLDELEGLGLYLYDNENEELYFNIMMNMVQPMAQNAGEGLDTLSHFVKNLVKSQSVEELDESIRIQTEELRERNQQAQQQQQALMEQAKKAQQDMEAFRAQLQLEGKLTEIDARAVHKMEELGLQTQTLANQYDINKNQQNDMLEMQREKLDHEAREAAKDRQHESTEKQKDRKNEIRKISAKPAVRSTS